jgi:hypothetical protein
VHRVLVGKPEGHWGDPDVDGRIILRGIFRKWERIVGTGWSGLRIGTGVRSTLTSSVAMATGYVHNKMTAATCYTYTGAIRKKVARDVRSTVASSVCFM